MFLQAVHLFHYVLLLSHSLSATLGGAVASFVASHVNVFPSSPRSCNLDVFSQVWVDAGSPKIPNTTLLSELQKASELVDEEVALVPGTGGCASAVVVLPSAAASVAVIDFNTTSV